MLRPGDHKQLSNSGPQGLRSEAAVGAEGLAQFLGPLGPWSSRCRCFGVGDIEGWPLWPKGCRSTGVCSGVLPLTVGSVGGLLLTPPLPFFYLSFFESVGCSPNDRISLR